MSRVLDGKLGERAACLFLSRKGYKILERNWYCRYGELDIITFKNSKIVFIEVKMRSDALFGNPYEYIDNSKLKKLKISVESYLHIKGLENMPWRLDAVSIIREQGVFHFQHFEGILPT